MSHGKLRGITYSVSGPLFRDNFRDNFRDKVSRKICLMMESRQESGQVV